MKDPPRRPHHHHHRPLESPSPGAPPRKPTTRRAQWRYRYRNDHFQASEKQNRKVQLLILFFFCHSQRKTNVLAAAVVTAPQKRKSSHLPAPFHVLWQNPDIANRTAVLFVESTGFSRRVRTQRARHMRDFFFGAPPDSAPSVGLKSQQLRLSLALLPASVTLQCQHSGSFTGDQPRLRGQIRAKHYTN